MLLTETIERQRSEHPRLNMVVIVDQEHPELLTRRRIEYMRFTTDGPLSVPKSRLEDTLPWNPSQISFMGILYFPHHVSCYRWAMTQTSTYLMGSETNPGKGHRRLEILSPSLIRDKRSPIVLDETSKCFFSSQTPLFGFGSWETYSQPLRRKELVEPSHGFFSVQLGKA
eukprot:gb/GECG01011002.1/.p1 GENE.gb/GECG01011002.1/~~gb/GECG01011002.1/.p1  ORF type:complete len:170 (+),score=3.02 gb/GECG01011002.1/:1-510(+)